MSWTLHLPKSRAHDVQWTSVLRGPKRSVDTYEEIKEYVLKETGLKVSTLYISQIKRKCGLEAHDNYNLSKKENARVLQCPPDKEKAIRAALKHFAMI